MRLRQKIFLKQQHSNTCKCICTYAMHTYVYVPYIHIHIIIYKYNTNILADHNLCASVHVRVSVRVCVFDMSQYTLQISWGGSKGGALPHLEIICQLQHDKFTPSQQLHSTLSWNPTPPYFWLPHLIYLLKNLHFINILLYCEQLWYNIDTTKF